ncbi:cupin domain-containing protein [Streptomyces decoyicus]|uniref:cupin domain-containing protein n=1 Tax=Streptomyces decoyicus TaxID=249567 RepID=UPI003864DE78|nr:cupin domain-containing protein [Streptomyces decoyicus]
MPFIRSHEAVVHEIHGARFRSYIRPATGSRDLAAWTCEVPAATVPPAHVISQEETFYVLSGRLRFSIDGEIAELGPGDAAVAPAGSALAVANPADEPAQMWVTTRAGLTAELADGSTMAPPWAT